MATMKNFSESVKEAGLVILGIFGCIVGYLLVSWPVYILLALFIPKFAAKLMYGKVESQFPTFAKWVQRLNGWIVAILPFFWKKHFIKQGGLKRFSSYLQLKYYFNYKPSGVTVKEMSCEAYRLLWRDERLQPKDYNNLLYREDAKDVFQGICSLAQVKAYERLGHRVEVIEMMTDGGVECLWETSHDLNKDFSNVVIAGRVLDDDMFEALCREVPDMVLKYVIKHTPSDAMLLSMFGRRSQFPNSITYCIHKYGLSAKVVRELDRMGILSEFEDTLREYMQRTFLQRHASDTSENRKLVKAFFTDMGHLSGYAQIVMKPWQARLFYEAGLTINEEVLESFIEKEDVAMIKTILELEPDVNISDSAGAMAMANPVIADLIVAMKKDLKPEIGTL